VGEVEETVKAARTRIYGASIAWIAIYAGICGATSLVPIFPYVGGGGFLPLCVVFEAIAPLILGPAGIISAFLGGIVGMFICPAAYPLGLIDVIATGTLPAVFVTLTIWDDKLWPITIISFLAMGVWINVFPYYSPGAALGFETPPQPLYLALSLWYWIPWLAINASPLGIRLIPKWARGSGMKRQGSIFIALLSGLMLWWIPWVLPYWYIFHYPVSLAIAVFVGYSWWVPTLSIITTIICIPIIEGLRRSGLPKIPWALW
jgi:hypothetical protein